MNAVRGFSMIGTEKCVLDLGIRSLITLKKQFQRSGVTLLNHYVESNSEVNAHFAHLRNISDDSCQSTCDYFLIFLIHLFHCIETLTFKKIYMCMWYMYV